MAPQCAGGMGFGRLHFQSLPLAQGRRRRDAAARAVAMSAFLAGLSAAPANAACAPDPASSGQTVTCSGNTPGGFQAGFGVSNLTVNVLRGATVSDGGGGAVDQCHGFQHRQQCWHGDGRCIQQRHPRRGGLHDDNTASGSSTSSPTALNHHRWPQDIINAGQISIVHRGRAECAIVGSTTTGAVSNLAGQPFWRRHLDDVMWSTTRG